MRGGQAAPDVSAANNDRNLDPEIADFLHALSYFADDLRRDILAGATLLQRFAAQLKDDAFVHGRARFTLHGEDVETERRRVGKQNEYVLPKRPHHTKGAVILSDSEGSLHCNRRHTLSGERVISDCEVPRRLRGSG